MSRKSTRPYKSNAHFHPDTGMSNYKLLRSCGSSDRLDAICLMVLTMADLFNEAPDLFVAGMAAGNHRVEVFSFCRYDPTVTWAFIRVICPFTHKEQQGGNFL